MNDKQMQDWLDEHESPQSMQSSFMYVRSDDVRTLIDQIADAVASQNVEEFIAATGFETSHKSGKLIRADHLRAWMAGHARAPVEATQEIIMAMGESQAVDDEGIFPCLSDLLDFSGSNKTRVVLIAAYNAMLTASKESGK